jgi:hypothetical protein
MMELQRSCKWNVILRVMIRPSMLLPLLFGLALPAVAADPAFAPLRAYEGSWRVTPASSNAGAKPYQLTVECAVVGQYFTCQQTTEGRAGGLLVIIPTGQPGRYNTQTIMPDGRATGRDELEISGSQWTFRSRRQEGTKTTQYRTTYSFSGKDRIHFEQAQSSDGKEWTVTNSGDQIRTTKTSRPGRGR